MPDLFIESGLTLIRRQLIINGRRPDILFSDALSRHLIVEIQRGRLDENHLQRHFYYYFDYRAKFPSTHLRLMFIANRLGPQHKEFLDAARLRIPRVSGERVSAPCFGLRRASARSGNHQSRDNHNARRPERRHL